MDPVLDGVVVERQQLVHVVGDFGDGFGEFGPIDGLKRLDCVQGVSAFLGVPYLGQGLLRTWMR